MALPNPSMDFNAFDTLPAASLDDLVENIQALYTGSAFDTSTTLPASTLYNAYKFSAYQNSNQTLSGVATDNKLNMQTELYDTSSNFNNSTTYRFTAPIAGFYSFNGMMTTLVGNNAFAQTQLYVNGTLKKKGNWSYNNTGGAQNISAGVTGQIQLAASDYVELYGQTSQSSATVISGATSTYFEGKLDSKT